MAVADQSQDQRSREFVQALVNSQYFDFTMTAQDETQVREAIDVGKAKAGIIIPPDFTKRIENGDASVLNLVDGSGIRPVSSPVTARQP